MIVIINTILPGSVNTYVSSFTNSIPCIIKQIFNKLLNIYNRIILILTQVLPILFTYNPINNDDIIIYILIVILNLISDYIIDLIPFNIYIMVLDKYYFDHLKLLDSDASNLLQMTPAQFGINGLIQLSDIDNIYNQGSTNAIKYIVFHKDSSGQGFSHVTYHTVAGHDKEIQYDSLNDPSSNTSVYDRNYFTLHKGKTRLLPYRVIEYLKGVLTIYDPGTVSNQLYQQIVANPNICPDHPVHFFIVKLFNKTVDNQGNQATDYMINNIINLLSDHTKFTDLLPSPSLQII